MAYVIGHATNRALAGAFTVGFQTNRRDNELYIAIPDSQPFYTAGDLLKGHVRVDPTTRPTRISISLKAYSVINGAKSSAPQAVLLDCTQDLFVSKDPDLGEHELIQRGTSSDGKVYLPFFFTFPQHVSLPPPESRSWVHPDDVFDHPRFQHTPGFALPPTCATETEPVKMGVRERKLPDYKTTPKIIYQLEAYRDSTTSRIKIRQEIKFIPPAPEYHPALLQPDLNFGIQYPSGHSRHKLIRTRKLLPNYENFSKREKFKDALMERDIFGLQSQSIIPYVKFNVLATAARIVVIGSRVPAIITVQHLERSEHVPRPPELFLRRIKVRIHCIFNTFVPPNPKRPGDPGEPKHTETDEFVLLDKKYEKESGEPLYDGLNLLDVADVKMENENLVPSFTSYGVNLEHEITIEIWGQCLDREWQGIACTQPVQLVSDWHAPGAQPHPADPGDADSIPAYLDENYTTRMHGDGNRQGSQEEVTAYAFGAPPTSSLPTSTVPPPPYVG